MTHDLILQTLTLMNGDKVLKHVCNECGIICYEHISGMIVSHMNRGVTRKFVGMNIYNVACYQVIMLQALE